MRRRDIDYEKFFVREPLWETAPVVRNRQSPGMTFMSTRQVPEAKHYIKVGWIYDIPDPNPHIHEHVHAFDEIVLHVGGDPYNPLDLGAEVEYYVGGQPLTFSTTTALFIPAGIPHGPLTWKSVTRPHIELAIMIGSGVFQEGWGKSGIYEAKEGLPKKRDTVDYERYLVRKPVYEQDERVGEGRHPTMTFMASSQAAEAHYGVTFGWVFEAPGPGTHAFETAHTFDEILLHLGGDPENPLDLGGEIEYDVGGQRLMINGTSTCWVPKGLRHGPLLWKKVQHPHLHMAIRFHCGDAK